MKRNESMTDRLVRIALAALLVILVVGKVVTGTAAPRPRHLRRGAVRPTGAIGFCGIYAVLGISTLQGETRPKGVDMLKLVIGAVIGGAAGFAYYKLVGCSTGTCPITSNPYISVVWGCARRRPPCGVDRDHRATKGTAMAVSIIKARCPQNHPCPAVRVCPGRRADPEGVRRARGRSGNLHRLRKCVRACPRGALVFKE